MTRRKKEPEPPKFDHPADAPDDTLALGDRVQLADGKPIKNRDVQSD